MDASIRYSLLFDCYGGLLTRRQQDVVQLYHNENLSLSEIAEEFGISRQGVHDALKNAEAALDGYEEKLGLARTLRRREEAICAIDRQIDAILRDNRTNRGLTSRLQQVRSIIDQLDE
ncbi:MAG: YlxM family DNA-binding protein [Anaerovoracaceae bacterium]|jgi:predicted DNA-binding protein YlxM (UPF0122 family)